MGLGSINLNNKEKKLTMITKTPYLKEFKKSQLITSQGQKIPLITIKGTLGKIINDFAIHYCNVTCKSMKAAISIILIDELTVIDVKSFKFLNNVVLKLYIIYVVVCRLYIIYYFKDLVLLNKSYITRMSRIKFDGFYRKSQTKKNGVLFTKNAPSIFSSTSYDNIEHSAETLPRLHNIDFNNNDLLPINREIQTAAKLNVFETLPSSSVSKTFNNITEENDLNIYQEYINHRLVTTFEKQHFLAKEDLRNDFIGWVQNTGRENKLLVIGGSLKSGNCINNIPFEIQKIVKNIYGVKLETKKRQKKNGLVGVCFKF